MTRFLLMPSKAETNLKVGRQCSRTTGFFMVQ